MTRDVTTCELEMPMTEAEKLMHKHRIRHLPVMDGAKLVGMLSIRDVMVWRWQESRDEANVLRDAMIAVRNRWRIAAVAERVTVLMGRARTLNPSIRRRCPSGIGTGRLRSPARHRRGCIGRPPRRSPAPALNTASR